jgi:hypothetical protein
MILNGLLYILVGIVVCVIIGSIGLLIEHIKEQDWFVGVILIIWGLLATSVCLMFVYAVGYVVVNIGKAMFF